MRSSKYKVLRRMLCKSSKLIILLLLFLSGVANAQWTGTSLRTDGKYRAVKNTAAYLGRGIDSVYADLVYLVNQDSISNDVRIDSIKAILGRLETQLISLNAKDFATAANQSTANTTLSNIDGQLTTLNAKDFATAANQSTQNTTLANIETNTSAANKTGGSISSVNYSSYTQLPNQSIKGIIIYNYSTSDGYVSYDNGTNYIIVHPQTQWVNDGLRNSNVLYVKGELKIEYRN